MESKEENGVGRIPLLVTDPTALMLKYILLSPIHLSQGKESGDMSVFSSLVNSNQIELIHSRPLYVHRQGDIQPALLPNRIAVVRQLGQETTGAD